MVNRQKPYFCFTTTCAPVSVCCVDFCFQLVPVSLLVLGVLTLCFWVAMTFDLLSLLRLLPPNPVKILVVPVFLAGRFTALALVTPRIPPVTYLVELFNRLHFFTGLAFPFFHSGLSYFCQYRLTRLYYLSQSLAADCPIPELFNPSRLPSQVPMWHQGLRSFQQFTQFSLLHRCNRGLSANPYRTSGILLCLQPWRRHRSACCASGRTGRS